MRKTRQELKEDLKNARIALKGLNQVRRGAEQVLKNQVATWEERNQAGKDLIKATREWRNQYLRVESLKARI